jgi:hypothetical protein
MSFRTVLHEVNIEKDTLLDLFFGQGNLLLTLPNEEHNVIINEFGNHRIVRIANHVFDVKGFSKAKDIPLVDGRASIEHHRGEVISCTLELRIHDNFE